MSIHISDIILFVQYNVTLLYIQLKLFSKSAYQNHTPITTKLLYCTVIIFCNSMNFLLSFLIIRWLGWITICLPYTGKILVNIMCCYILQPMDFYLIFNDIHLWAVVFAVFMMNFLYQDGMSNYFQGSNIYLTALNLCN